MQYGLIGEKLGHSFSAWIHRELSGEEYNLCELNKDALVPFFQKRAFTAVNVTIPYKTAVIELLDEVDARAAAIGAVNTVVNRNGRLIGYNTDYAGLRALIETNSVSLKGKSVLILGTGGTSLTARQVALDMGAREVHRVSRSAKESALDYAQALCRHDTQVLINTTPVGMYPAAQEMPISLEPFTELEAVFDVIYNPLQTALVLEAKRRGITAQGGLFMLVAQAVFAGELFYDTHYPADTARRLYQKLLCTRRNILLTGMPGSGKSTVGALLAASLGREFADTDKLIVQQQQKEISELFAQYGEAHFRALESEVIAELCSKAQALVIATGGGAVLDSENVKRMKQNGKIYFLDREIEQILPTSDRPLSSDRRALKQRFEERYDIYLQTADRQIKVAGDASSVAAQVRKDFLSES